MLPEPNLVRLVKRFHGLPTHAIHRRIEELQSALEELKTHKEIVLASQRFFQASIETLEEDGFHIMEYLADWCASPAPSRRPDDSKAASDRNNSHLLDAFNQGLGSTNELEEDTTPEIGEFLDTQMRTLQDEQKQSYEALERLLKHEEHQENLLKGWKDFLKIRLEVELKDWKPGATNRPSGLSRKRKCCL